MRNKLKYLLVVASVATGAGCGGESEGNPLPQPGDDWYPAHAQFSVGAGAPGNREVTIHWGTSVAECGTPDVDGCAYDSASITLNEAELNTGAKLNLQGRSGYSFSAGRDEDGAFPPVCSRETSDLLGNLSVLHVDLEAGRLDFEVAKLYHSGLDGQYIGFRCNEPAPEPVAGAVFEETNDGIKLSWGSSARSCGDTLDVSCEQAKAEVTIPATQLVPGARLLLTNLGGQLAASFIDGEGAGCSTGQQTLAGTAEIFSTTPNEIRFRIEGNEFGTTSVDGYYSATRCN